MHRSTTSPRFLLHNGTKVIMNSNQHILCYVGTGWFSRTCRRVRNWPFWSHSVFFIRANAPEYCRCYTYRLSSFLHVCSWLDRVVHFPNCYT